MFNLTSHRLYLVVAALFIAIGCTWALFPSNESAQGYHYGTEGSVVRADSSNKDTTSVVRASSTYAQAPVRLSHSEQGISLPIVELESIFDLIDLINSSRADELDLDTIVDYVAQSPDAFDYISTEYVMTLDAELKDKLRIIIDNVAVEEKTDLALQLIYSESIEDQQSGYVWLLHSEQIAEPKVYNVLIDALNRDEHSTLYSTIITSFDTTAFNEDDAAKVQLVNRLIELADSEDKEAASVALSKAIELAPNNNVLEVVHSHIAYGELEMQVSAIEQLHYFDKPSDAIIYELNNIMHNPSAPQRLRQASVQAIVAWQNSGAIAQ